MPNTITAIIPFLNEGIEVFNTVESIRNTSENVGIILINDASTDGYDYRSVAEKFDTVYIEHSERKGVAASRDEGVRICETEYFILLDAHMRVYQDDWVSLILSEMRKESKQIICCKTIVLNEKGERDILKRDHVGYGAFFNFKDLSIKWITFDAAPTESSFKIPCVLGASYVCSKLYWEYLHGLSGLRSYGQDEQLISLKVWLTGGVCKVLKDVCFGHIFRRLEQVPYDFIHDDCTFNKLWIAELFLDIRHKISLTRSNWRKYHNHKDRYYSIIEQISSEKCKMEIMNEKGYYNKLRTYSYDDFLKFNNTFKRNNQKHTL